MTLADFRDASLGLTRKLHDKSLRKQLAQTSYHRIIIRTSCTEPLTGRNISFGFSWFACVGQYLLGLGYGQQEIADNHWVDPRKPTFLWDCCVGFNAGTRTAHEARTVERLKAELSNHECT